MAAQQRRTIVGKKWTIATAMMMAVAIGLISDMVSTPISIMQVLEAETGIPASELITPRTASAPVQTAWPTSTTSLSQIT